ncbi:MAG: glycosyltransferase family 4 protein [Chthoniobacterales bacterium]|nr:glycosyltransferase family 4 protein [Chthoniobacterales bacterium]
MLINLPFFGRRHAGSPAPEFIDIDDRVTLRELEKSCGRELERAWAQRHRADGRRVREFYLASADLQARYPLGLLPIGQRRLAKWLLKQGRSQHDFSDEQVLAFLAATAAHVPEALADTYLIMPQWQERFPAIGSAAEQRAFLEFLGAEFRGWRALRKVNALPVGPPPTAVFGEIGANLLAHFCYPSGLQQGGLATKAALESASVALSCRDVPVGMRTQMIPRRDWLGWETFPTSILIMAPVPYTETAYVRAGLYRKPGVYRIAYWSWELDSLPAEWPCFDGLFDEIWTPSTFVAETMRTRFDLPIAVMPHAMVMAEPQRVGRSEIGVLDDHYVFLFMFDICSELERKNPLGLIRAFRRAFSPDQKVTLLLKLVRGELDPAATAQLAAEAEGANIVFVNEVASRERALGFVEMCDCYVSLHRSEGFGLTVAEAMSLRKPVIATGYSGNLDFMDAENSFLVDYAIVPVESRGPNYQCGGWWAEPSEEHAAALMRSVWLDRDIAAAKAQKGRARVIEQLAPTAIGRQMRDRLLEIARR